MDCVFCRIRDGQIPSTRVYEDERTIAFMDINPLNEGHTLVISRAHATTLFEADEEDLRAAIATAKRVATAIREALRPDGLNLLQANGVAAFQSVPHFHFHLIPRAHAATLFEADEADLRAAIATAKRVAKAIREALRADGLNLLQANGAAAFQSVPHFHFHLIPRFTGDGKGFDWPVVAGDRGRIQAVADRIRGALA